MFFAKVMLLIVTINLCVYLLVERITNCIEKMCDRESLQKNYRNQSNFKK